MPSRRVLITTTGSHGDVFPFLGVGRELAERADVRVLVNPYFESVVRDAGLIPMTLGEHLDVAKTIRERRLMEGLGAPRRVLEMLMESADEVRQGLTDAIREWRPDVMLAHHITPCAALVARREGIPLALAALSPMPWFGKDDPVPVLQQRAGAGWNRLGRFAYPIVSRLFRQMMKSRGNRMRRRLGFAPEPDPLLTDWFGGDINLGLWSPHFRPPLSDDPPRSRIVGFPFYDGPPRPLAPKVDQFLSDGEPPIIFSLGTTAVHVAGSFYADARAACQQLGRRGLLLMGAAASSFHPNDATLLAVSYAPLSLVTPHGAATVVHGGIGSVSQALRGGHPTLTIPFAHDQFHNGLNVVRLGVGATRPVTSMNAQTLTSTLDALLRDVAIREKSAELATKLRDEEGAGAAADAVLRVNADRYRRHSEW